MSTDKITTYQDCLTYMYEQLPMFQRQGPSAYKKNLENTIKLCDLVGNPHKNIKSIHIAGTNGKGTTSHIIAAGLQAQGYTVGVYTSPHYKDFRERIKINGKYISRQYILKFINTYKSNMEIIKPSFFEMTVALAFAYFRHQKVDYAVIETGLGGRLDSTNVITPLLSVITNISYDHQNMLGDTLPLIAGEKAGIIKPGIPVIVGESQDETNDVFVYKATETSSTLYFAEDHIKLNPLSSSNDAYNTYEVVIGSELKPWIPQLRTDLHGPFQEKNLKTGLFALYQLSKIIPLNAAKIAAFFPGLAQATKYMGRWQILSTQPMILADSAHNEAGIKLVLQEMQQMTFDKLHVVLGFVNDKDVNKVLASFPKNAYYYFAKANIPRGLEATILAEAGKSNGLIGKPYSSVKKALAAAKTKSNQQDMIYVGGSIFVVAEVI